VPHPNYAVAEAYLAAVTAGDLPDRLLTDDMTAWLTTQGPSRRPPTKARSASSRGWPSCSRWPRRCGN